MSKNEQSGRACWNRLAEAVAFALEAHAGQMREAQVEMDTKEFGH